MIYQRIKLTDASMQGAPGEVPDCVRGLDDGDLADLTWVVEASFDLAGIGYWPVEIVDPAIDPATQALSDEFDSREPDAVRKVVVATRGTRPLTAEELAAHRNALIAHAADMRWQKETGGVVVAGVSVLTDRASQSMISGAVALCDRLPVTVVRFKAAAGFVDLDAAAMTAVAIAVGQHVQACFAKEGEVVAAIEAGTITTREQIEAAFA